MEKRYTKKDFHVGQEVFAEYVGLTRSENQKGDISVEIVTNIGNKYVTTNKRKYFITDGTEVTEYTSNYVLWADKDEVKAKIVKDNVFLKLADLFKIGYSELRNQGLYKKLSLEDLQKNEQIVDKAMEE